MAKLAKRDLSGHHNMHDKVWDTVRKLGRDLVRLLGR